jgi:hypothetical protein
MRIQHLAIATATLLSMTLTAQAYVPPTMGWSSWNTFGINISDKLIVGQANAMASKGLKNVGYKYVNIDDGYFGGRDATTGQLFTNPTRFPKGLKWVVDSIHSLGFKAGIYSDGGSNTCGSIWNGDKGGIGSGLYGHDQQDADLFFKTLGFDFIKIDYCGGQKLSLDEQTRYMAIRKAIDSTGRKDVVVNICRWAYPGTWANQAGDTWRISGDINASWGSIKGIIDKNLYLSAFAGEGHYNDMDMLEIGRGLPDSVEQTHFGMWCLMSSPLLIGCNMSNIPAKSLALLCNKELIAVNQDTLGLQAYVTRKNGDAYILTKDLEKRYGTTRVVGLYNPSDAAVKVTLYFKNDLQLDGKIGLRDLFAKTDVQPTTDSTLVVSVPAHDTYIYKVTGEKRTEQTHYEAETAWLNKFQDITANSFARAMYNAAASGGTVVGWLGNGSDNYMEWRDIYSQEGGDYKLTLSYIINENRNATLTVNGKSQELTSLNSGGKLAKRFVSIKLNKGLNTIRISNSTGWTPDIDAIDLTPKNTTEISDITKEPGVEVLKVRTDSRGRLSFIGQKNAGAKLYNEQGKLMRNLSLSAGENEQEGLPIGIYFVVYKK